MKPWADPRLIPNRDGFKLRVLLDDGTWHDATVRRDPATGLHSLDGADFVRVRAWAQR